MTRKIPVLNILRNGFDDNDHIFLTVLFGLHGKSEEHTLILSRKTARFLIQALVNALESKKFIKKNKWR